MWWWLVTMACELIVDFDPGAASSIDDPTGSTAQTGDTGSPAGDVPTLVTGTECGGFILDPEAVSAPIDISSDPITGPITFPDVVVDDLLFGVDGTIEVTVGDVPGPRVAPSAVEGSIVFAQVSAGQLFVASFCALSSCENQALRITLPEPAQRVVGEAARGDVTITDAAVTDIYVGTGLGDVRVTGNAWGVRAAALDGSVTVDLPAARVVDLHTSTGPITMRGTATTELCAISDLGNVEVTLGASNRAWLETTNGDIVADLSARVAVLDLAVVVGGADVRLPGGAYDIDLVSIPQSGLTLDGIVHDATAPDRITGSSLGTGTLLRAR